jgi:Xaa-Pro aminopeptidase
MNFRPSTKLRLQQMRKALTAKNIDGLFVPRTDEFQGEYVPASSERLQWLTGFTGSWGSALIGKKTAALIIDGRYTIQATTEAPGFEYLSPENAALTAFLKASFKANSTLAYDPWVTSITEAKRLRQLVEAVGLKLQACSSNLVDDIWKTVLTHRKLLFICIHSIWQEKQPRPNSAKSRLTSSNRIVVLPY